MGLQHATPVTVDRLDRGAAVGRLVRLKRSAKSEDGLRIDEALLQRLIHHAPSILPVEEIEPVFGGLRSICVELPLRGPSGEKFVDNLLINPDGKICLVECKLWRNAQAVREVVAQILDYASELSVMSYEGLVAAARKALRSTENDPIAERVLGQGYNEDDYSDFVDVVSRSLRLGNFLLLVMGDGIRPEATQICTLLQNRATMGFSLGLVETAIYASEHGGGPYYIQPRILIRTEIVTRTVFLERGEAAAAVKIGAVEAPDKAQSISEREFFDELAQVDPSYPGRLRLFLDRCREIGCEPVLRRLLSLYAEDITGRRASLATIRKNGTVEIWGTGGQGAEYGETLSRRYMERVVGFLPGSWIHKHPKPTSTNVRYEGKIAIPMSIMLDHSDQWLEAIREMIDSFRRIEQPQE
jgi:hypothetical protein